ncbi:MAG: hypothetical protein HQL67_03280 [Magnetococcales bacterium]|nr:hypothetical protein [Magnetococcales bacterium]
MSGEMTELEEKMNRLKKNPSVFDIIKRHSGVKDFSNLSALTTPALNRLKRYVDYYYGIVTCPA